MSTRSHFVAHLKIERIEREEPPTPSRPYQQNELRPESKREVAEVTSIIIKAEELNKLQQKLIKHIDLVEDDF